MELSEGEVLDDLLIDNLKIIQNVNLYRFTSDSVLLSRFAQVKANDVVADFCAGSGIVGLHFYALHAPLVQSVTLFELQPQLYEMSKKTIELNGLQDKFSAICCPVQKIPREYCGKFSLILCNPPYESGGFDHADEKKAMCRKEIYLSLAELCKAASFHLKYGGRFCLCHRADRMAEVMYTLHANGLEPKRAELVAGKAGGEPYLLLLEAVKGGKPGIKVAPMSVN